MSRPTSPKRPAVKRRHSIDLMRVLYILDSLAPGGTERSTVVLASRLRHLGVETTIVTLRSAAHDIGAEAEAGGVEVMQLAVSSMPGRVRELRGVIRSGDFDLVHTALYTADQLGRIAAWRTGVPVVSSFVSTPYEPERFTDPSLSPWKIRVVQAIDAMTGRWCVRRFHAVSDGTADANSRALRIPRNRVIVAERGRDAAVLGVRSEERRRTVRFDLGVADDALVVLGLGRLDHQKGHTVLIESSTELARSRPELVVLIAGKDGSASAEVLAALADDPIAPAHVRLLGHRTDVGDLLCAADVLVISSHVEGTAGVAVEAMALSTPVVSTDLIGLHGILEHDRNAVLVPANDPRALASGIERVVSETGLADRLAAAGRSDFAEKFTLDGAARRLRDLYSEVIALGER